MAETRKEIVGHIFNVLKVRVTLQTQIHAPGDPQTPKPKEINVNKLQVPKSVEWVPVYFRVSTLGKSGLCK